MKNNDIFNVILQNIACVSEETNVDHIVFGGDFSSDLSRFKSLHTNSLNKFCEKECLIPVILHDASKLDYTYRSKMTDDCSILVHFIVTENVFASVIKYQALIDGANHSDHNALIMKMNIPVSYKSHEVLTLSTQKVWWNQASEKDIIIYKLELDNKLNKITAPQEAISCTDYSCKVHDYAIQQYYNKIVNALLHAAKKSIPCKSKRDSDVHIPGWNKYVSEHRDRAIFWHKIWIENEHTGRIIIADIWRQSRANYYKDGRVSMCK